MVQLNQKQIFQLLKLISDPKDRKIVDQLLRDLQKAQFSKSEAYQTEILKKRTAKKALNIIWKIGTELGKHKLIEEIFHLLD